MRLSVLAAALLSAAAGAESSTFNAAIEVGAAHFVGAPQGEYFGWGQAVSLKLDLKLVGPLALEVGGAFVNVEPRAAFLNGPGRLVDLGLGPKLRLFDDRKATSPFSHVWVDGLLLLVGTGPLVRFGYELGVGALFSLTDLFGIGPYVRFVQVIEPGGPGIDGSDALMLHAGVCLTLHLPAERSADERDTDGDGVVDLRDRCPRERGAGDGCPVIEPPAPPPAAAVAVEKVAPAPVTTVRIKLRDRDGDGLGDSRDACPNEPETFNGFDDEDGCPDPKLGPALVTRTDDGFALIHPLRFTKDGGAVDAASRPALSALARMLALFGELKRFKVELGDPDPTVARLRAAQVRDALVEAGVNATRFEVVGVDGKSGAVRVQMLE